MATPTIALATPPPMAVAAPMMAVMTTPPVKLRNKHGKYLIAKEYDLKGHHDPSAHGAHHSSHFHIEPHPREPGHIVIRAFNGKYVHHDYGRAHPHLHHENVSTNAAWKLENHGSHISFKSRHHHYLGCNDFGDGVEVERHDYPHDKHKFDRLPC